MKRTLAGLTAALTLGCPPAFADQAVTLTPEETHAIQLKLIQAKPNVSTVTMSSFLFPGSAQAYMGHTDRNAVFVFYAWTAVVSLSVLLMYIGTTKGWPGRYWPGVAFLVIGCIACVLVTLPPARRTRPVAPEQKALS